MTGAPPATRATSPVDPLSLGVGTAIRAARLQAALSMRTLAGRCGVSQPFLSEVERGMAMPSIATLYRIADALGLAPAHLLPAPVDDVLVVRASGGRAVASSERPGSAVGRLVLADDRRGLEVYEYVATDADDLDVWFEHAGEKVLHLIEGELEVQFERRPPVALAAGDVLVHPGAIPAPLAGAAGRAGAPLPRHHPPTRALSGTGCAAVTTASGRVLAAQRRRAAPGDHDRR